MERKPQDNGELIYAFPSRVHGEVRIAISALPENQYRFHTFSVLVEGESISIPYRICHNDTLVQSEKLSSLQKELIDCILTRHHDGFVRQRYLSRIIKSNHRWVPPFVVQLLGEYVIEIIRVMEENLGNLDASIYAEFLQSNPRFLNLTEQRVISYRHCYYRTLKREEYSGFRVLRFFKELAVRQQ